MKRIVTQLIVIVLGLGFVSLAVGCTRESETARVLRIGYFPNVSHAPAMVGFEEGIFESMLPGIEIQAKTFPNGSLFMDALATGEIDLGYVGPGPAINRFLQGGNHQIIGLASTGENVLVARRQSGVSSVEELVGKVVATPSTGCTHDLLFRELLDESGLAVEEQGGNVKRLVQKPAAMLGLFAQGQIDAAMVSEPWASLMVAQGLADVIVEADQVPWNGNLPATVIVAGKAFLDSSADTVAAFLEANSQAVRLIEENRSEAVAAVGRQIDEITGQSIDPEVITSAMNRVNYGGDIDPRILQEFANLSGRLGFLRGSLDLDGLFL